MSSLLKEAIVDANALKEAALKNAEATIIEKYSGEVKDTIKKLLEQDELDMFADEVAEEPMADDAENTQLDKEKVEEVTDESIPLAAVDGLSEEVGVGAEDTLGEGEDVEFNVNLEALQEAIKELRSELEEEVEISEEVIADVLGEEEKNNEYAICTDADGREDEEKYEACKDAVKKQNLEEELEEEIVENSMYSADPLQEIAEAMLEEVVDENMRVSSDEVFRISGDLEEEAKKMAKEYEKRGQAAPDFNVDASLENARKSLGVKIVDADTGEVIPDPDEGEDIGISEEMIDAIMEELFVDTEAALSGWTGRSSEDKDHEIEKELARRRSTDEQEELEVLRKAQEELVFENSQIKGQVEKYKQTIEQLKEALQDINLSNARLLYTNRALKNASLNERQKNKIAEAISKADTVMEAKTIYNTLQSTMETNSTKSSPQSLSEAIGRSPTTLRATRKESKPIDPVSDRMKKLAGIK